MGRGRHDEVAGRLDPLELALFDRSLPLFVEGNDHLGLVHGQISPWARPRALSTKTDSSVTIRASC
jgi:hypothetical protein